jgi:hypothetical protein
LRASELRFVDFTMAATRHATWIERKSDLTRSLW